MTQYNSVNVKVSNPELNKLRSVVNYGNEATIIFSSNITGDRNNETFILNILLITNRQVLKLYKTFANSLSTNVKLSKNSTV